MQVPVNLRLISLVCLIVFSWYWYIGYSSILNLCTYPVIYLLVKHGLCNHLYTNKKNRSLQRVQCPSAHHAQCQTVLLSVLFSRLYGRYWLIFSVWFTTVKRSALRNFTDRNIMISISVTDGPSHRILSSSPYFLTNLFQNFYYLSAEMWRGPVMS